MLYEGYKILLSLLGQRSMPYSLRYVRLGELFHNLLNDALHDDNSGRMSGDFAKMTTLCQRHSVTHDHYLRLNALRRRLRTLATANALQLSSTWDDDVLSFALFAQAVTQSPLPAELSAMLPHEYSGTALQSHPIGNSMRVVVQRVIGQTLTVLSQAGEQHQVLIADETFRHLLDFIKPGSQLNIIRPHLVGQQLVPELVVYEPDYLVDITTVTSCFAPYGTTSKAVLVKRMQPVANSVPILLGNFASQLLDEAVYSQGLQVSYSESVRKFFSSNTLSFASIPSSDLRSFHDEAKKQRENIHTTISQTLKKNSNFNTDHVVLEPSFVCEMLGLQGRMDLITDNRKVLLEQKSGKRDEFNNNSHKEDHYVQMLLYLAVLQYCFGMRQSDMSCYLYYSKYVDGLMCETSSTTLLQQAIECRNEVVAHDELLASGQGRALLENLSPNSLNVGNLSGKLWSQYILPQLQKVLEPMHNALPLEKDYYFRMLAFVARENHLAKIGSPWHGDNGFASLWNTSSTMKAVDGSILMGLTIASLLSSLGGAVAVDGVRYIQLDIPSSNASNVCCATKFRIGDIVLLYPYYDGDEPDARKTMVLRCTITDISATSVIVALRAPQRNKHIFNNKRLWAIESDYMESSGTSLYRQLHCLFTANAQRRNLLLCQTPPRVDTSLTLRGDYGAFNSLVLHAKQNRDVFLVIGPPGTGKTSFGMLNILKEELAEPRTSVLLLSYTNRAVDEICSKLHVEGIDFVRFGNGVSCPATYRRYLLSERVANFKNVDEVRSFIESSRIFVGTTTSAASHQLFHLKHFSLAIIDEASQILEPQLVGLFGASQYGMSAIDRFVMIGDHKQLPAVVLQSEEESRVAEPSLQHIGLTNCRNSLFERLYNWLGDDPRYVFHLSHQGRMHPMVAQLPNTLFYNGKLSAAGISHQQQALMLHTSCLPSSLRGKIASQRVMFFDCPAADDLSRPTKVNDEEADLIARLVVEFYNLYVENGKTFSADTIGVIVPYRHQIANIYQRLAQLGIAELGNITVDTVERYQGSQRDVIIYGFTVRRSSQLSFLTSTRFVDRHGNLIDRKLNVAMTRAKEQMVFVGNATLLSSDSLFAKVVKNIGLTTI